MALNRKTRGAASPEKSALHLWTHHVSTGPTLMTSQSTCGNTALAGFSAASVGVASSHLNATVIPPPNLDRP
jgi:hypothetical protein